MADVFDFPGESSETGSGTESLDLPPGPALPPAPPNQAPNQANRKRDRNGESPRCQAWKCQFGMRIEFAESDNGLSVDEKTKKVTDFLQLRTGHNPPRQLKAFAVFLNCAEYCEGPPGLQSVQVIAYVQTRPTTAIPLKKWMGDECVWTPIPGGLYGNPEFLANIQKPAPWKLLPIISTLALNNAGRQMKRVIPLFSPNTPHIMIFPILHIDD